VLNRVEICGNLPADPAIRFSERTSIAFTTFTVVLDETYWDWEAREKRVKSHFISCVCFAELAEAVAERYRKGDTVLVLGQLSQTEVEKAGGKTERKTKVNALTVTGVRKGRREEKPADTAGEF
jgi:single stranded DNA-binding protein